MHARLLSTALLTAGFAVTLFATDGATEKPPTRNAALRAQMIEDAKKQTGKPAVPPAAQPAAPAAPPAPLPAPAQPAPPPAAAPAHPAAQADHDLPPPLATAANAAKESATVLPKIEVNRGKLHPLARELYEKEKEISREKQLTKPTELDKALNHPKLSVPLLGGQSTTSRASVAAERTALLEAEADLIEEIGRARTQEQKTALRQQLDALKKVRRDLEHAIR